MSYVWPDWTEDEWREQAAQAKQAKVRASEASWFTGWVSANYFVINPATGARIASDRAAAWDESQVARDEKGQFSSTGVGDASTALGTSTALSPDYQGPKGDPTGVGPSEDFRRQFGTTAKEMRAEPPPKTVAHAEDRIRGEPSEHGFLVKDGAQTVHFGSDKKNFIVMRPEKDVKVGGSDDPLRDGVFTHNHPSNNAQSPDDVYTAAAHNMKEIRAVVADGTYSVRRVGDEWPPDDLLRSVVEDVTAEVRAEFDSQIAKKLMTFAEANAKHWPTVWKRVVRELHAEAEGQPDAPQIAFAFEPKKAA